MVHPVGKAFNSHLYCVLLNGRDLNSFVPETKLPEQADPPWSLGRVALAAPLEVLGVQVQLVQPRHGEKRGGCCGARCGLVRSGAAAKRRVVGEIVVFRGKTGM